MVTVRFKPGHSWTIAQDAPIKSPGGSMGADGPERGPSPTACSLGDVAARQRPAGHRKERSRARRQRAAGAWCPCPGARHVVPRGWLGRGGAAPAGPRRCQLFTSDRGGSRGEPRARGAWCPSRPTRGSAPELYKPTSPTEFLDTATSAWRGHRRPHGRFQVDVHICP